MVEKIRTYLNSKDRDYDLGLSLLSKFSKNRIIITNLGRKKNVGKLEYELKKFTDRQDKIDEAKNAVKAAEERTQKIKDWKVTDKESAKELLDFVTDEEFEGLSWTKQLQPMRVLVEGEGNKKKEIIAALKKFKHFVPETPLEDTTNKAGLVIQTEKGGEAIMEPGRVRIIKGDRKVKYEDVPAELQLKWTENIETYNLARGVHSRLKIMSEEGSNASDEDRKPLVEQLGIYSDLIRSNWDAIDAHFDKGGVKETVKNTVDSIINAVTGKIDAKRISANRKFLTENLPKFKESKDEKLKAKIQLRVTELITAKETFKEDRKQELIDLNFELGIKPTEE